MLGMAEGTSKWHLNNARKTIQKALQKANANEQLSL
jgi:DNA-directed RNA polymerase specialized sigma24 family protein